MLDDEFPVNKDRAKNKSTATAIKTRIDTTVIFLVTFFKIVRVIDCKFMPVKVNDFIFKY